MQKEKLTIKEVETRQFKNDPERIEEESKSIKESLINVHKLLFEKKASVEIKKDALGNKSAVVSLDGSVIYATDDPQETANFELYLVDPEAAMNKFLLDTELGKAEEIYTDEVARGLLDE